MTRSVPLNANFHGMKIHICLITSVLERVFSLQMHANASWCFCYGVLQIEYEYVMLYIEVTLYPLRSICQSIRV